MTRVLKVIAVGTAISLGLDLVVAYLFLSLHDGSDFPY